MFFKTKVAYPGLIRSLCLENIKWYNDLLDNDNTGFSQEIHEETCLIYLNVSLMTYFLMHGEIIHRNALPSKYSNAHVLKGASSSLVMDKLSDSGVINNNEEYLIMNEQVCKFINTIMLENMDAFNKVFKRFKII